MTTSRRNLEHLKYKKHENSMDLTCKKRILANLSLHSNKIWNKSHFLFLPKLETEEMLANNPNIGKVDPLFQGRSRMYRSLIIRGLSKVVYCIEADTLYIVAMWDTRKDPIIQASKAEES